MLNTTLSVRFRRIHTASSGGAGEIISAKRDQLSFGSRHVYATSFEPFKSMVQTSWKGIPEMDRVKFFKCEATADSGLQWHSQLSGGPMRQNLFVNALTLLVKGSWPFWIVVIHLPGPFGQGSQPAFSFKRNAPAKEQWASAGFRGSIASCDISPPVCASRALITSGNVMRCSSRGVSLGKRPSSLPAGSECLLPSASFFWRKKR